MARPHAFWFLALRRLGHSMLVLVLVSMLAFLIADLSPGDPFSTERLDSRLSAATIDAWRARAGLDDPLPVRYGRWLTSVARGELGMSIAHRRPVAELLLPRLGATLALTVTSTVLAWCLALLLGSAVARHSGGALDRASLAVISVLQAMPELLLALLAAALAVRMGLPFGGLAALDADRLSWVGRSIDLLRHAFLPLGVLTLAALPSLLRHVRTAMVDALESPHVLAARAQGLGGRRLFFTRVLPLAANPLISLLGTSFGALVSGSLVVEVVLGWPGVGPLMLDAVFARDLHVVVAGALVSAGFLLAGNMVADLAQYRLNPRLIEAAPR